MFFINQLNQLALGQHDVGQVEAREFDLLRQRTLHEAAFGEAVEQPVVERALILELQRTDRVRDVFQRVLDRMREGVHRIDAPAVAGVVVRGMTDAVNRRIAQVDVRRRHVDLRAQDVRAIGEFAGLHAAEEQHVFFGTAAAIGRVFARLGQRTAIFTHLLGALAVDVGVA